MEDIGTVCWIINRIIGNQYRKTICLKIAKIKGHKLIRIKDDEIDKNGR